MRLDSLNYGPLLIGILGAAIVVFADPVSSFLKTALPDFEISGVVIVLVMALFLLAVILHQRLRQAETEQRVKQDMETMASDVRHAEERARELAQLVRLGEALAAIMDPKAIHQAVTQYLKPVLGQRQILMTVTTNGPRLAIGGPKLSDASPDQLWNPSHQPRAWDTFPMFAGGKLVGFIWVGQTVGDSPQQLSDSHRRLLEMAASLVGLSIKNAQLFRRVHKLSAVDVLTGCLMRQHGLDLIASELHRAQRSAQPTSVLFIDLDHFKQLNDQYGHLFGDTVLRAVGAAMKETLRSSDLRCRYGGEEFVVMLPDTPLNGAKRVAESIRRHLARRAIERPEGSIFVTVSIGVTTGTRGELDAKALVARSDAAMYRAKRDGCNCVRVWEDYPEWRQSQALETASPADEANELSAPKDQPDGAQEWRLVLEGVESDRGDPSKLHDNTDDWDEI